MSGPRRRVLSPDEVRVWRAVAGTVTPLPGRDLPNEGEPDSIAEPSPKPAVSLPSPPQPRSAPAPRLLPNLGLGATPGLD
ncbi:MAG TPA: hypothetical protein VL974_00950, partial [Magnetospirillum sp.]|nr:hypothetical protein [Magnetospirillum sp.]